MPPEPQSAIPPPGAPARLGPLDRGLRALCFLTLAAAGFLLPAMPSLGLDSAWQMALGRFFVDGRQFGTEIVFTYGPLGWTMGNMYAGHLWGALIAWHAALALVMAALLTHQAFRLPPLARGLFLVFFIVLGLRHEDIQQQAAILLIGLELIRRGEQPWRRSSILWIAVLAVFSLVKFTNLVLAGVLVALACVPPLGRRDARSAGLTAAWFGGLLLLGWVGCGQHPANLPAYLRHSWEISSGYQDAMGWSCPSGQLYHGLAVAALMVAGLVVVAVTEPNRLRGVLLALAAATYLYLSWKHGFIRADGHQLIFYWAVLTLALAPPLVAADHPLGRRLRPVLPALAALLALRGAELATPDVAGSAWTSLRERLVRLADFVQHPGQVRERYDWALDALRQEVPLPLTRAVVGNRSLDILGFEQDVGLLNGFNYTPRPVFQSYSAYTPRLAELNRAFYESARAPEFVLFKVQTIDGRLETMDDAPVLDLLTRRYRYLVTERGFSLWQLKPAPAPAPATPAPIRTATLRLGESLDLADLRTTHLWVQVDYRLNLLGRLRRFLFKPPAMRLQVTDEAGASTSYRLPGPVGATGFQLSPLIRDVADYLRAANGESGRRPLTLAVAPADQDRDCFAPEVRVTLTARPAAPGAGWAALPLGPSATPLTFVRGQAPFGAQLSQVEGELLYYVHAPATLVYRPAAGATGLQGGFGFYDGAFAPSNGSPTDGAEFIIRWRGPDGREAVLFSRLLRPRENPADRGLQSFQIALPPAAAEGELEFIISPGPAANSASDWTYWRNLRLGNSL